jgi:hypothetical protein
MAYRFMDHPVLFLFAIAAPPMSLGLSIWVGGIVTQDLTEAIAPCAPRPVDVRCRTWWERFVGVFFCQTYWLLATRGAWRVLAALALTGRSEPAKDRSGP